MRVSKTPTPVKTGFNAVIEGSYLDELRNHSFKLIELLVPKDCKMINDLMNRYVLYGLAANDFQSIKRTNGASGLETTVDVLSTCSGIVVPQRYENPHVLDVPRVICTKDRRLFVSEKMLANEDYMMSLQETLTSAGRIFSDPSLARAYERLIRN